ncbi:MAG TPA: bifunctional diaminohydroxyphosphoribosylaminopyrimidine deaminase/5-amino-6-(5-phosphoribosylamino)uracil reductase RibD [Actinomycetota bacterium]|nr:bifunctional diaminohydroxyphosphoribosylaminopyrimidine deaminase/5-amino-6-(5-phosphoribosylamino)uracil reductase RibD [Actinomycetota bacterium]
MPAPDDRSWMHEALCLAAKGRGRTSPNPMVGCVLVNDGVLAGSGWHRRAGGPHAEVLALAAAGARAEGATAFVTLEPCAHHGRTPPCVHALIAGGVSRVVAAMEDPDPRTAGRGLAALRAAGIKAEVGLLFEQARRLNEQYVHHRTTGRPFVTYKAGVSLDGRTAAADGSSQWITSPQARLDAHRLRARSDAVCAGVGTVLADDPQLTPRGVSSSRAPLRVVVDSHARTPPGARVLSGDAPTVVFTAAGDGTPGAMALKEAGAEVVNAPGSDGRVSLTDMLQVLGEREIVSLLLEGGATLAGGFAAQGLIDRFVFYVAPKLLGSSQSGALRGFCAGSVTDALDLVIAEARRIGPDLRVTAYPVRKAS